MIMWTSALRHSNGTLQSSLEIRQWKSCLKKMSILKVRALILISCGPTSPLEKLPKPDHSESTLTSLNRRQRMISLAYMILPDIILSIQKWLNWRRPRFRNIWWKSRILFRKSSQDSTPFLMIRLWGRFSRRLRRWRLLYQRPNIKRVRNGNWDFVQILLRTQIIWTMWSSSASLVMSTASSIFHKHLPNLNLQFQWFSLRMEQASLHLFRYFKELHLICSMNSLRFYYCLEQGIILRTSFSVIFFCLSSDLAKTARWFWRVADGSKSHRRWSRMSAIRMAMFKRWLRVILRWVPKVSCLKSWKRCWKIREHWSNSAETKAPWAKMSWMHSWRQA